MAQYDGGYFLVAFFNSRIDLFLRAELERRARELECRFKPAPRDMRELAQLKEFLKITPTQEPRR
jgi:hypothetical protein